MRSSQIPGRGKLATRNARHIVNEIVPCDNSHMGKVQIEASRPRTSIWQNGIMRTVRIISQVLWRKISPPKTDFMTIRRTELGLSVGRATGGVVVRGPFSGTKLPRDLTWGAADLGGMLLGFYEEEIVAALKIKTRGRSILVDVGAGDGFYVNGALASGMVKRVIVFESDGASIEVMRCGLRMNNIESKVEIFGHADEGFSDLLTARTDFTMQDSVILFDIEGGEYDILNEKTLEALLGACLIIELHEFTDQQIAAAAQLVHIAEKVGNTVSWIHPGGRNPYGFAELERFSDNDKWALVSEGRPSEMRWLVLESAS